MKTGIVMYDKRILIFFFFLLPSVSLSGEPDEVNFRDTRFRSPLTGEARLSNSIYHPINKYREDISLTIQNVGEDIVVNAYFTVPVTSQLAWETLTDFDNIASFISSVQSSKVINKTGNTLRVSQNSVIKFSITSFNFESVREINLVPFKQIKERLISGNMKKMEEITKINFDGNQTHITYQANITPDHWIFKYIGHSFIEDEARKQFEEIRTEIIRRKRIGYRPGTMKNTLHHIQNSGSHYNFP